MEVVKTVRLEMVPRAGVEPARPYGQRILSPLEATLPSLTKRYEPVFTLNRLKSVSEKLNGIGSDTFTQAYVFDRWGNRTINQSITTSNVPHPNYTVDPLNLPPIAMPENPGIISTLKKK